MLARITGGVTVCDCAFSAEAAAGFCLSATATGFTTLRVAADCRRTAAELESDATAGGVILASFGVGVWWAGFAGAALRDRLGGLSSDSDSESESEDPDDDDEDEDEGEADRARGWGFGSPGRMRRRLCACAVCCPGRRWVGGAVSATTGTVVRSGADLRGFLTEWSPGHVAHLPWSLVKKNVHVPDRYAHVGCATSGHLARWVRKEQSSAGVPDFRHTEQRAAERRAYTRFKPAA